MHDDQKRRLKRHIPKTPPDYWRVDFPSIKEQREKGLLKIKTSPLFKKNPIRRILNLID